MTSQRPQIWGAALRVTFFTLVLTGIAYPFATAALTQAFFQGRSNGSLVHDERGEVVGSEFIGQAFNLPGYFQGRPSAAGDKGYDANASGGSNLAPTAKKLRERVVADLARLEHENLEAVGPVPAELVLASGSGLDPEISPEAALWQIPRVAHARGVTQERLRPLVIEYTQGRQLGFLGEARVNVLLLNLALDRQLGRLPQGAPPK
jgi:potassium-transporting ATPase KdpC subunit